MLPVKVTTSSHLSQTTKQVGPSALGGIGFLRDTLRWTSTEIVLEYRVQYLLIGPLVGQFNSPVSIDIGERVKYVGQWSRLNVGGFFIIQGVNEWASNWSFVDYIR